MSPTIDPEPPADHGLGVLTSCCAPFGERGYANVLGSRKGPSPGSKSDVPEVAPVVRHLIARDIRPLMLSVGPLVDSIYDRGAEKLLRRLEEARDGYAIAHVVVPGVSGPPVALAAEVMKGPGVRKLSTFWVAPSRRRRGYGALLLEHRIADWANSGIDSAHVTVRQSRAEQLEGLFLPRGFERALVELNRYGDGRDEVVLRWRADSNVLGSSGFTSSRPLVA